MEQWKDIPGFENYMVSDQGRVWSKLTSRVLCGTKQNRGYLTVSLGRKKKFLIHRLVMLTFVGECPEGHEVNHINGIKTDNRLENLEYVTDSENSKHAYLNKLWIPPKGKQGEESHLSKLTDSDVKYMRQLYNEFKFKPKQLSELFKTELSNVYLILKRKTWKHI